MKASGKRLLTMIVGMIIALTMMPTHAHALTAQEYWNRSLSFVNNEKWRDGANWYSDCSAYARDYTSQVFGLYDWTGGTYYTDVSQIRTGDVIHDFHDTNHYFVVIERNGNKLYTAEGNATGLANRYGDGNNGPRALVTDEHYYLDGSTIRIYDTFFHGGSVTFLEGWHFDTGGATTRAAAADRQPVGNIEAAEGGAGTIHVKGWTYDPDVPSSSVDVHVYINGSYAFAIPASGSRPDVNSAYGVSGNHGFDYTFSTTERGSVRVAVYAINNNGSGGNPPIRRDGGASEFIVDVTSPTTRNGTPTDLPGDTAFLMIPLCSNTRGVKVNPVVNGTVANLGGVDVNAPLFFQYKFVKHSSGNYGIQLMSSNAYYLHVSSQSNIVSWQTYGNNNSLWVPEKNSDGSYSFRNASYGTYIDVQGARDAQDSPLVHWPGNGSSAQKFRLVPVNKSIADSDVEVTCPDHVAWTGSAAKPAITVRYLGVTLREGEDYTVGYSNNTSPGTATVTITGVGGTPSLGDLRGYRGYYTGSRTLSFTIGSTTADISEATVSTIADQTYTGSALKPAPTVKIGSTTLKSGTDYTLSYKNNTNVGTATITITGKGNYTGTRTATFKVVPASLSKATVSTIADQTYTGRALKPAPMVKIGSTTLKSGTDYTLSYKNNTNVGTATITITGKGNYTGTRTATFKVVAADDPDDVPDTVAVYRLYNHRTSEHLWTTSANEYEKLPDITDGDWRQEDVAWNAPDGEGTPVYRLYNRNMGDHYYSMDANEIRVLTTKHGWTVDNNGAPAFWSAAKGDEGAIPLYCVYNRRLKKGQHHFTASENERNVLVERAGWRYEKVAFYGYAE